MPLNIIQRPEAAAAPDALRVMSDAAELTQPQEMWIQRSALIVDLRMSVRRGVQLDTERIARYRELYETNADVPRLLVYNINGELVLVDGFHRSAALDDLAKKEGRTDYSLLAMVVTGTWQEAEVAAADSNIAHGRPLTQEDLREAMRRYLTNTRLGYADIGRRLGVAHTTVMRLDKNEGIRRKGTQTVTTIERTPDGSVMLQEVEVDKPEHTGTVLARRGGQTYEVDTTNISKADRPKRRTPKYDDPQRREYWQRRGWSFAHWQGAIAAVQEQSELATAWYNDLALVLDALINQRYSNEAYAAYVSDSAPETAAADAQAAQNTADSLRSYTPAVVVEAATQTRRVRLQGLLTRLDDLAAELSTVAVEIEYSDEVLMLELEKLKEKLRSAIDAPQV